MFLAGWMTMNRAKKCCLKMNHRVLHYLMKNCPTMLVCYQSWSPIQAFSFLECLHPVLYLNALCSARQQLGVCKIYLPLFRYAHFCSLQRTLFDRSIYPQPGKRSHQHHHRGELRCSCIRLLLKISSHRICLQRIPFVFLQGFLARSSRTCSPAQE